MTAADLLAEELLLVVARFHDLRAELERVEAGRGAVGLTLVRDNARLVEAWGRVDELERIHNRLVGDLSSAGLLIAGVAEAVGEAPGPGLVDAVRRVVAERTRLAELLAAEAGDVRTYRVALDETRRQREHWRTRAIRAEVVDQDPGDEDRP